MGVRKNATRLYKYIENEMSKGYIAVTAGVDKNSTISFAPIKIINHTCIDNVEFDYLVITAKSAFWEIYDNAISLGISESKIIDGDIFTNSDFDFFEYEKNNRLTERIFGNLFYDYSYADRKREYHNQNISISMGRKSYIGKTHIETGFSPVKIRIGNFSAISWDIVFELGQNMDHDYHRVMNYGMTHLDGIAYEHNIEDEKSSLEIGSDVWIGKGTKIKGGVHIGNGSVIASNSYVVRDIPNYAIVGGNPACFIKYRFSKDVIRTLERTKWWNWPSEKILANIDYFNDVRKFMERFS